MLLFSGFAEEDGTVAPVSDVTPSVEPEDDRDAPPEVEPEETTTTAAADPAPAPEETSVLVANAGGPAGAAGATTEELQTEGYQMGTAVDATEAVESTQVQYAEGAEAAAAGVAAALGVGEDAVVALSDSPPVPDLGGAEVLVLLGPDTGDG